MECGLPCPQQQEVRRKRVFIMPYVELNKTSRRNFLRTSFTAAGMIATLKISNGAHSQEGTIRWAFCADTHMPYDPRNEYRGFRPYDNMGKLVSDILAAKPEGGVITGDLARLEGFPGDYANLKRFIDPLSKEMPICMALGNHDNRKNFLKYFSDLKVNRQDVSGKYVLVVEHPQARFIILDSLMYVNKVAGFLGKNQRQWITEYLNSVDDRPVLFFVHHTLSDNDGDLLDVERLFRIIKPINKVKAIVYGHSHAYRYDEYEGIHLINLPAVGYNFSDSQPLGWVEASLNSEGGNFKLHAIGGDYSKDKKVASIKWR